MVEMTLLIADRTSAGIATSFSAGTAERTFAATSILVPFSETFHFGILDLLSDSRSATTVVDRLDVRQERLPTPDAAVAAALLALEMTGEEAREPTNEARQRRSPQAATPLAIAQTMRTTSRRFSHVAAAATRVGRALYWRTVIDHAFRTSSGTRRQCGEHMK